MFSRSDRSPEPKIKRSGAVKRRSSVPDPEEAAAHLRRLSQDFHQQLLLSAAINMSVDTGSEDADRGEQSENRRESRRESDQVVVVNEDGDDTATEDPASESEAIELSGIDDLVTGSISSPSSSLIQSTGMKLMTLE